jgi:hypothetical protein
MVDPVSGSIQGEGEMFYGPSVDLVIESKEDAEASVRQDGVCKFRENVMV